MKSVKSELRVPAIDAPASPLTEQIAALKDLFPQAFTEGKIDFGKLRALLGDAVETRPERYSFSWAGKRQAIQHAQTPSQSTLLPVRSESVDFDTTGNLFVEGDNLEVLKLLHRSYFNSIKMIYIDPPYNTGNDFVYPDDFADALENYLQVTGQKDAEGRLRTSNPETSGRYHSTWLSMMYPRLVLARSLLREDGLVCVSIGEEELHHLRLLLNEIFGEENYRNTLVIRRYDKNLSRQFMDRGLTSLAVGAEYVLIYSRTAAATLNPVFRPASTERQTTGYWKGFHNAADRPTMRYDLLGVTPQTGQWKWKAEVAREAVANYQTYLSEFADRMPLEEYWEHTGRTKRFIRRSEQGRGVNQGVEHWIPPSTGILRTSNWTDVLASDSSGMEDLPFDSPKNVELIKQLTQAGTDDGDTVLDFFAGSGTTAQAVLELNHDEDANRHFILVQLPEVTPDGSPARQAGYQTIAELTQERIRRVITRMRQADVGTLNLTTRQTPEDLGFRVFKLGASTIRHWAPPAEDSDEALLRQLELMTNTLASASTAEDVVWEAALREGYRLSSQIARVPQVTRNAVYQVADTSKAQSFYICLDDHLDLPGLRPLALTRDTLFVCRAQALDDTTGANLALMCRLKTL